MDLRQLRYLVAVADEGSFTAAARAVHVSQPSLSHGIRSLELELGTDLFVRLPRRAEPTDAGRQVIDAARRVLRDMADLTAVAAAVTALSTGTLDVVSLPTLAVDPLATLIGRFRVAHPGVAVRVHEPEDGADLERLVRSGEAELGISDLTSGGRGLKRVELFRQRVVAVTPPGSSTGPLSAHELAQLPLIVTPVGTSTRRLLDQALARQRLSPTIAVELNHRDAIVPLVLAGAGAALLPLHQADDAAARGAIVRPLQPELSRRIGLLHRPGRLSPAAAAMVALAVDLLRRRGSGG